MSSDGPLTRDFTLLLFVEVWSCCHVVSTLLSVSCVTDVATPDVPVFVDGRSESRFVSKRDTTRDPSSE